MFKSRYLEFTRTGWTGKTDILDVESKSQGSVLGQIKWFGQWRQYCFYPSPDTIFNPECMADISKVINELMLERKKKEVFK